MKNTLRSILFLVLLCSMMFGCRREIEFANWDVEALAPVAYGTINFSDYSLDENVELDASNLVHVVAKETLLSIGLDTLIGIPDYKIDTGFVVPVSLNFPPGVPFFYQLEETTFDLEDVELNYALIRESNITIFLENTIDKPVLFQYGIYSATLDGDTFLVEARVEANDTLSRSFTLDGYELDLTGEDGNDFNTVVTFLQAMIHPDETQNHQFNAGDEFNVSNTVTGVIPEIVSGYFGNQSVLFEEDEKLEVFNQFPFESLDITDFNVSLIIDNGIGADLRLNVNSLSSLNTENGSTSVLNHEIVNKDLLFSRAINTYDLNDPVKHIQQELSFTDENSNLADLFEIRPNKIFADLGIEVNPLGDISLGNDFAYFGHNLSAFMSMDVPLVIGAKGVRLSDTSDLEIRLDGAANAVDRINYGSLNLILDNGYPVEAAVQIYLLDTFYNSLDSLLLERTLIMGAEENSSGIVELPAQSNVEIPIDQALFDELEMSKYIRVNAILNTVGMDSVHIKSTSSLAYKLVADINARTKK